MTLIGGEVTSNKKTVYCGGLSEDVDEECIRQAFLPFGEISDVQLPLDYETQKHRGFAFVEFQEAGDAKHAIDNMNEAELLGRTLRVNLTRSMTIKEGAQSHAIWDSDEWLQKYAGKSGDESHSADVEGTSDAPQQENVADKAQDADLQTTVAHSLKGNPEVFFDISVGRQDLGRMSFTLYADMCPKTVENFRCLVTHEKGFGYASSTLHRIIPGFMAQGGDFTKHDGTGGRSIYGSGGFADENFVMKHDKPGLLSMANSGPNTNKSQFFITFAKSPWLDGKHVVFGHINSGMSVLRSIEKLGTKSGKPTAKVVISSCGQV